MSSAQLDRAVEIERLAALDTVDYEVARKGAADRLGIRASILDDLRNQKRRQLKLDGAKTDEGQGRTLALPEVMPGRTRLTAIASLKLLRLRSNDTSACPMPKRTCVLFGCSLAGRSINFPRHPARYYLANEGVRQDHAIDPSQQALP